MNLKLKKNSCLMEMLNLRKAAQSAVSLSLEKSCQKAAPLSHISTGSADNFGYIQNESWKD